jgi:hypothetical protein
VAARLLSSRSRRTGAARTAGQDAAGALGGGASPRHVIAGHPVGAARLAKVLRLLEAEGWVSLALVKRPGAPDAPPIDHLVIGPGGVVVIDSRSWVGRVEVSRGVVAQNGFWRDHETASAAQAAGCIAALLLPQHRTAVHAMICITQHDLPEQVVPPGVHVLGVSGLVRALRALPHRLHPAEVLHLNTVLRQTLVETEAPEQLTTAALDAVSSPGGSPGAHREPEPVAHETPSRLFVPAGGGSLCPAARSAARRQRPSRPWWRSSRVLIARVLLAVLLVAAGMVLGPGVVHTFSEVVDSPAVTVLPPSGADAVPADPGPPSGRVIVPPMWSGGAAPVQQIPSAATAHEEPLESLAPVQPPGHPHQGHPARGGTASGL